MKHIIASLIVAAIGFSSPALAAKSKPILIYDKKPIIWVEKK